MYSTEVKVKSLPVETWLSQYCFPDRFRDSCKACPDYGRVWSCPPGLPEARALLGGYRRVFLVGVRVVYSPRARLWALRSPEVAEGVRRATYGVVKKAILEALLALEGLSPGASTVAAGRCEQCEDCTRPHGLPCRRPERLRPSFSALGFDLTALAREVLDWELLWAKEGLPEYDTALAAFLTR